MASSSGFGGAAAGSSGSSATLDEPVARVVRHPSFQNAVSNSRESSDTVDGNRGRSFANPQDEFRAIFRGRAGGGSSSRPRPYNTSGSKQETKEKGVWAKSPSFSREVVLLKNSQQSAIVRGKSKALLYREGFVLSSLEFLKNWSADQVHAKIEEAFADKLLEIQIQPK